MNGKINRKEINKIALIVAYFGKCPEFIKLFLKSCWYNEDIDFVFFSDWDWETLPKYDNVKDITFNLAQFNELASKKCGIKVDIKYGYKLCDLKPAWPHIFEDYLMEYDFVGYCDIDLIFGKINKFFTENVRKSADIFTITDCYMSGALTICRNIEKVRKLYQEATGWKFIFQSPYHFAFDESLRIDEKAVRVYKTDASLLELQSFTDVVFSSSKCGKLRLYNPKYIGYEQRPKLVSIKNGHVYAEGKEWIFFHYVVAKQSAFWTLPNWKIIPDLYFVNKYGFYKNKQIPLRFMDIIFKTHTRQQIFRAIKNKKGTMIKLLKNFNIRKFWNAILKQ